MVKYTVADFVLHLEQDFVKMLIAMRIQRIRHCLYVTHSDTCPNNYIQTQMFSF